jgi:prevent-host-death family protein
MKRVAISELKAKLSEYLNMVQVGEEVIVTDRGRAIARLGPLPTSEGRDARLDLLVRSGRVRPPGGAEPLDVAGLLASAPSDPRGLSLEGILADRREGR